jgi:hypothetical protein
LEGDACNFPKKKVRERGRSTILGQLGGVEEHRLGSAFLPLQLLYAFLVALAAFLAVGAFLALGAALAFFTALALGAFLAAALGLAAALAGMMKL